jgi:hypothetical protein
LDVESNTRQIKLIGGNWISGGTQVFAVHAIRSLRPRSMGSPSPQRKFRRKRRKRNGRLMLPMHLKLCFSMASRALGKL